MLVQKWGMYKNYVVMVCVFPVIMYGLALLACGMNECIKCRWGISHGILWRLGPHSHKKIIGPCYVCLVSFLLYQITLFIFFFGFEFYSFRIGFLWKCTSSSTVSPFKNLRLMCVVVWHVPCGTLSFFFFFLNCESMW